MPSISDPIPNSPFYSTEKYSVSGVYSPYILGNGIAIDQFGVMNVASALGGTVTSVAAGTGLSGGPITTQGVINLVRATPATLGGIKVGANLSIDVDGTLNALAPGIGTITGVTAGVGLNGGGTSGNVTIALDPATTSTIGGVIVPAASGLTIAGAILGLASATTSQLGGVRLATSAEVISGLDTTKVVTAATLATKVATTAQVGLVQLSDSVTTVGSRAATSTAVKTVNDAAAAAQATATAALPKAGGTMTGIITFAPGQTFPGVALPKATTASLGVVQIGAGLNISTGGVLSTANNGTVTAIVPGIGLGAPATGNTITTSGTINLLPPSIDGTKIGGVRAGANITIDTNGVIRVTDDVFLQTNNPYSFNGYLWPIPNAAPALPCPGTNGQVLTIIDNVSGAIGWTNTGTLNGVTAGTGISVATVSNVATVSLATVPSVVPGTFGGTGLIPTLAVNQYGQITSTGLANPYAPFLTATVTAPPNLVLDFNTNNTNWEWTITDNTTISNPLNAVSGMTGAILITQDPITPYLLTWGSAWKFQSFTPFSGGGIGEVALLKFTVVSANYIVVDSVVTNLG